MFILRQVRLRGKTSNCRLLVCLFVIVIVTFLDYRLTKKKSSKLSREEFLDGTFCGKLFHEDWALRVSEKEIKERNAFLRTQLSMWENVSVDVSCEEFLRENSLNDRSMNDNERTRSMAFTLLIYKDFYQFQVLFRTLYVRTNCYCLHIDLKASTKIYEYAKKLSECLENVYLTDRRMNISWGTFSLLQVERLCQQILIDKSSKWFYYMTIAGSELPIQTNRNRLEIFEILSNPHRLDISSVPQYSKRQSSKNDSFLGNRTINKGEFHSILTRPFLLAIHQDRLVNDLWVYLNETSVPDEHFYSTLVHWKHLPSTHSRVTRFYPYYELLSHYKNWKGHPFTECLSQVYIEGICQFNYQDLFHIEQSRRLFANKFNQEFDLVSLVCWQQWFRVKQSNHLPIQTELYRNRFPFTTIQSTFNSTFDREFQQMIKYFYRQ